MPGDLTRIIEIFDKARSFMRRTGNMSQWTGGYPSADILMNDIRQGNNYVIVRDEIVVGTFAFILGPDSTYSTIEGRWLDDRPYGTIHRIASDGSARGVADTCLEACRKIINNIRIDTHRDNKVMLKWIERSGFSYCGIIHLADGSPRMAFQLIAD